jgi:Flp pilus assembly protein TadD
MRRLDLKSARSSVIALGALTLLAGCTSFGGAFGDTTAALVGVPSTQSLPADKALVEAKTHFGQGDYGYSASFYKQVVELTPNDPEGFVGLAASYDRLRRFDLSDRVYAQLLQLSGPTAQYYNNIGYSYMLRGNLPAARASFLKAKSLAPGSIVVANNLQLLGSSIRTAQR